MKSEKILYKSSIDVPKLLFEIFMILLSFIILIPFVMMLLGSFKTQQEAIYFNLSLPEKWQFNNYLQVIQEGKIIRSFLNSMLITSSSVTLCLIATALASFVIARRKDRAMSFMMNLFMIGMIAPMSMIPTIRVLQTLHLTGSYLGVILIYMARNIPWSSFIFIKFIKGIPMELDESAIIDGCGPHGTFFKILLPLLKPVTVTTLIIVVMNVWNDFMIPLYFLGNSKKWTMPLTVYNFFGRYAREWNLVFADLIMTALPVVLLYLFCQKYIIAGLTAGSVKG
ncbi:carbohydrate ABC transporter permease [Vallitalea okinawensis]|uniref:carbohydrate ABC transporter permease n=1 Tax=Vallitalea okinawensis TaxID=2078660 RepID=UPI001478C9DC|nr:carbohydrate ABC transporter permease [Vallitalea okinawensis]